MELQPLQKGSQVVAGTVLGKVGKTEPSPRTSTSRSSPPASGAPKIDPKPILDGWKLLEATAIYRAAGQNPFTAAAGYGNVTQELLLASRSSSARCSPTRGSRSTPAGATTSAPARSTGASWRCMEYLADSGFRLTITSLKCGHSILTTSGNVSEHTTGDAMDIADDQRRAGARQPGAGHARPTR